LFPVIITSVAIDVAAKLDCPKVMFSFPLGAFSLWGLALSARPGPRFVRELLVARGADDDIVA